MDSLELIHQRLKASWDRNRYESLFRKVARFNGCDPTVVIPKFEGIVPVWPRLRQTTAYLGEAMDSIYAMESILARLRSRDIRPDFIDLESDIVKEARAEWWMQLCRGRKHIPGCQDVHDAFVMWGIGFGAGVIEVGLEDDDKTGVSFANHEFVEGYNYLSDPLALTPRMGEYGAAVKYMCEEEFKENYPKFTNYRTVTVEGVEKDRAYSTKAVRVIRYFSEDTFCLLHHDIDGEEIERKENPWGRIPFAVLTHLTLPGSEYGIGKVDLMQPLQETRNRVRRHYQSRLDSPAFKIVNNGVLSDEAITLINDPEQPREQIYKSERPISQGELGIIDLNPPPLDPGIERLMQEVERAFNPAGATTNFAMGTADPNADTATEANLIADQSSGQQSLIQASYASAMEDLIQLTFHIAKIGDDFPLNLNVKGVILPINQGDEDLSCETLFEAESQVVLSEEGMFASDQESKRRKRVQTLMMLRSLAMEQGIDPTPITEDIFEAEGYDFSKLTQNAQQTSQVAPGMDGQGMPPQMAPQGQMMPQQISA